MLHPGLVVVSLPPISKAHDLEPSFQQTDDFGLAKSLECYQDQAFPAPYLSITYNNISDHII